ncbi:hypothetical protein [Polaribacter sp.]|uniref:hypothetical protein n=1 Tax=Polaribacter sp. TaxID=1920175 RepID=UPI003EF3220F
MKKSNFFWVGYADLMTSLFFIMLVLFVVTISFLQFKMKENERIIVENKDLFRNNSTLISSLQNKEKQLNIEIQRLNRLLKIEEQFKPLEDSPYFVYLDQCKKFVARDLIGKQIFESKQTIIKNEFIEVTVRAGEVLENFLKNMQNSNPDQSYLLVIEGNMANELDKSININDLWGYKKSYERALAVYNLWQKRSIDFRKYNVEVMICGSGFNGLCRDKEEGNNKRFSIQIIPKTENQSKKNRK